MKRIIALTALFALLLCACGRTTDAEQETSAAAGSAEFRLPDLPDIGSYQPKKAACFYDAPLPAFREAGDYGGVIPYQVTAASGIPAYGFMTTAGKIITAPVYLSVETIGAGKNAVYAAEYKTRYFTPGKKQAGAEDDDFDAMLQKEASLQRQFHLITLDGSKMLAPPVNAIPQLYYENINQSALLWIECAVHDDYAAGGGYLHDTGGSYFYGFDLKPLPELPRLSPSANSYTSVLAKTADGLVLAERIFSEEEGNYNKTRILTYQNGSLKKSVAIDEYISAAEGEILFGSTHIYDFNGNVLFGFSEDADRLSGLLPDCCFLADPATQTLTKIRNGKAEKSVSLPGSSYYSLYSGSVDEKPRLLVQISGDETWEYLVFDTNLKQQFSFRGDGWGNDLLYENGDESYRFFRQSRNGKTEIRKLDGTLLTMFPAQDETSDINVSDNCLFCSDGKGNAQLYLIDDGTEKTYDFSEPGANMYVWEATARFLVCCYSLQREDNGDYDLRENDTWYSIRDAATGALRYDRLTLFRWLDAGNKTYCAFSGSGCTYIADPELNILAVLPDGYYA